MTTNGAIAYIGLGANLGDAVATVRRAVDALNALPETRLRKASRLYRSAPWEASGPDFVNAVAEVHTTLDAHALLAELHQLEQGAGRLRPYVNAPRTLDLDLLLYGDVAIESPSLVVPHPRMWGRAFVLRPLADIAPHLVSDDALAQVAGQDARPM